MRASFTAPVWVHEGDGAWFFVTLPAALADDIEDLPAGGTRGFGSRRVEVTIGGTTWQTSIFPDRKRSSFLLPIKKAVRRQEGIEDGDDVDVVLSLL